METLKHPACTVGWVARLCRTQLVFPGKATRISHGRNPNGTMQLFKKKKTRRRRKKLKQNWKLAVLNWLSVVTLDLFPDCSFTSPNPSTPREVYGVKIYGSHFYCIHSFTYLLSVLFNASSRIQGYLFANDIKMCTGLCLGDVPIIQHDQYTTATSVIKNNY